MTCMRDQASASDFRDVRRGRRRRRRPPVGQLPSATGPQALATGPEPRLDFLRPFRLYADHPTARAISSVGRALCSHRRGHWFESSIAHHFFFYFNYLEAQNKYTQLYTTNWSFSGAKRDRLADWIASKAHQSRPKSLQYYLFYADTIRHEFAPQCSPHNKFPLRQIMRASQQHLKVRPYQLRAVIKLS